MTISLPAPTSTVSEDAIDNLLRHHGANFEVATAPTPHPIDSDIVTGFYSSYRTDTQKVFNSGLREGWTPIQNKESLKVITSLSEKTDVKLRHFFMFGGGREICAQIDLGTTDIGGGDKVSNYLSMINGHDGGHSFSIYETPFRWMCSNQISPSINNARKRKSIISIHHTISAKDKLEILMESVSLAHRDFRRTIEIYRQLRDTKVSDSLAFDILAGFFPLIENPGPRAITIRKNKMQDLMYRYFNADSGRTPRETAWNLYNAVQGHLQHYGNVTESRQKSMLIGNNASRAAKAMAFILAITASQHLANALSISEKEGIAI